MTYLRTVLVKSQKSELILQTKCLMTLTLTLAVTFSHVSQVGSGNSIQ